MTPLDAAPLPLDQLDNPVVEMTARGYRCPTCHGPLVGARIYDGEAFVGVVCETCDDAYRVMDVAS